MANQENSSTPSSKKLYLSTTDKKLAGVCGGIAEYFGMDSTIIRVLWIVVTVASGIFPGILAYIVCAVVIPKNPEAPSTPAQS
jgi:phage shock protein PspC (stress-responsive transcriptional regulator)